MLRDNTFKPSEYIYMNIRHRKQQVYNQFCEVLHINLKENIKHINYLIKCYVCLTSSLGNHFLPKLTYISLKSDDIYNLIQAYK